MVLTVSGLNSGDLKATWGPQRRTMNAEWKTWAEESAFRIFYSGHHIDQRAERRSPVPDEDTSTGKPNGRHAIESAPVSWRFCDG